MLHIEDNGYGELELLYIIFCSLWSFKKVGSLAIQLTSI